MRILIVVIVVSALCLTGGYFSLTGDCSNKIKLEAKSPDGKYVATWFVRDCGATTDFSTIVNLRDISTRFDGDQLGVFIVEGQPQVSIVWQGARHLRIECQNCNQENIYRQDKSWKEVNVSY